MARHSTRASDAEHRTLPAVDSLRADQRARRDNIVASATKLMVDVDYDRIQVRDVAEASGVALGTLYRYFSSKDHLFACALRDWSTGFGAAVGRNADGATVDRVKATFRLAARAFERQPRVYAVMIQVESSKDVHAAAAYREFATAQLGAFGAVLEGSRLSEEKRRDVIGVMGAVLDNSLRHWQLGLLEVAEVYAAIDRAADLVLPRSPRV